MADWTRGLPQPGKYWAWCMYDGDMMVVEVDLLDGFTRVKNDAGHTLGLIGTPGTRSPCVSLETFEHVFSHYTPYTTERPAPPLNQKPQA